MMTSYAWFSKESPLNHDTTIYQTLNDIDVSWCSDWKGGNDRNLAKQK